MGREPRRVHTEFGQAQTTRRQDETRGDEQRALAASAMERGLAVATARIRRAARGGGTPSTAPALLATARGATVRLVALVLTTVAVVGMPIGSHGDIMIGESNGFVVRLRLVGIPVRT